MTDATSADRQAPAHAPAPIETLIIQGPDGTLYALPLSVVQQHCITEVDATGFGGSFRTTSRHIPSPTLVATPRDARDEPNSWTLLGGIIGGPLVGSSVGSPIGGTGHWPP